MNLLPRTFQNTLLIITALLISTTAWSAKLTTGQMAPQFSLPDSNGKIQSLKDYKGKTVILEWTNDGCPYVQKHYDSNNMQALQKEMTDKGVVWFSVISSKPGSQGYATGDKANQLTTSRNAHPTAVLLDPSGQVGRTYGAKTTPHMYIINPEGKLVYQGAIDNKPSARASSLSGATNYVRAAMTELNAGQPVKIAETTAYGCSVKY